MLRSAGRGYVTRSSRNETQKGTNDREDLIEICPCRGSTGFETCAQLRIKSHPHSNIAPSEHRPRVARYFRGGVGSLLNGGLNVKKLMIAMA